MPIKDMATSTSTFGFIRCSFCSGTVIFSTLKHISGHLVALLESQLDKQSSPVYVLMIDALFGASLLTAVNPYLLLIDT